MIRERIKKGGYDEGILSLSPSPEPKDENSENRENQLSTWGVLAKARGVTEPILEDLPRSSGTRGVRLRALGVDSALEEKPTQEGKHAGRSPKDAPREVHHPWSLEAEAQIRGA